MSVLLERYECPVGDCDFVFRGEPDAVKYARREHELVHDVDEEGGAYLAEKAAEPTNGDVQEPAGKTALEMAQEARRALLERPLTVRCADCLWEATGPTLEALREWAEHRRDEHDDPSGIESIERVQKPLTQRDLTHRSTRNTVAEAHRRKGGTVAAQENGGEKPRGNAHAAYWTRERAIEALRGFAAEHGRAPTQAELRQPLPSQNVLARLFGSQTSAILAAGLTPAGRGRPAAVAAVPPPVAEPAKGHSEGQKKPTIEPEPAPAQASEGTSEGTLVELAQAVEDARTRLTQAQSALDAAVDAMRDALEEVAA